MTGLPKARSFVGRAATLGLGGAGFAMAVTHALMCLGVQARFGLPAVGIVSVIVGLAIARRRRRSRMQADAGGPDARVTMGRVLLNEIAPVMLVTLLLWVPFVEARTFAVSEHDAVFIWAPKAIRAMREAPPVLDDPTQAQEEYPRGLGILTGATAAVTGWMDPRLPRLVPLGLFALMLLCAFDALSARSNAWGGLAAITILGSVPLALHHAASGYADVPLSAFILLAGVGLATKGGGLPSVPITLAGALGALVVKAEGLPYCAVTALVLAATCARGRAYGRALAALLIPAVVAAPWLVLRAQAQFGGPVSWHSIPQNAGYLTVRFDQLVREIGHFALGLPDPSPGGITWIELVPGRDLPTWIALAALLVLAIGRGGSFRLVPLGLLYAAACVGLLLSPHSLTWHVTLSFNRLVLQGLPLLLVAAIDKLTSLAPLPADYPARTRT